MRTRLDILMSIYPWVQMVVFSELAPYGPLVSNTVPEFSEVEDELCDWAKQHDVWLLPGSLFMKSGDKIYNTALVINPQGEIVGRYRKMFPFLPYEEHVSSGEDFCLFDVPDVGKFGVSICYDMWFPETSRTLAVKGAEVILHPTLTGTIDREIELSIVRATSAINQCYVFDINGLDSGGNGKSLVCGPDGRIIYQAGSDEEYIPIEINMERVHRSRETGVLRLGQTLKSFRDRAVHFDIYEKGNVFPHLESLGPLVKHTRSRHALHSQPNHINPLTNPTPGGDHAI
jgi:predicted amidohydrolase